MWCEDIRLEGLGWWNDVTTPLLRGLRYYWTNKRKDGEEGKRGKERRRGRLLHVQYYITLHTASPLETVVDVTARRGGI